MTQMKLPDKQTIALLPKDGGMKYNRLIHEKSPYLLQHAANPVDWYPWSDEAFEMAKAQDKPVFLSIGYATCHWCHVMERESFEDKYVAELLNEFFICVKVDREERPDIDHVYMTVTQAITGSGGWPMSVFLTPDRKPFYAGTYFPKTGRYGRPGMMELIPKIGKLWKEKKNDLLKDADQLVLQLQRYVQKDPGGSVTPAVLDTAFRQLTSRFDASYGGFGTAPKFPTPHQLNFLLRYWNRTGNQQALEMVQTTLRAMRFGGIFDQIGYGFHRYSTDSKWLVPHFEKMLYDQALLTLAYTETYQATGEEFYRDVVAETLDYVLRDMVSSEGGFFSAEDADSDGEEGLFYLWKTQELTDLLGVDDGNLYAALYNCAPEGNYHDEATGNKTGQNILHLTDSIETYAMGAGMDAKPFHEKLDLMRIRLFSERKKRNHPLKDDKILTDWNGLMIAAMAKAGRVLGQDRYITAANSAADFILARLRRQDDGRLMKRYRDGEAAMPAQLEDYAFFVWGLLELYESTFDAGRLETAVELTDIMIDLYHDDVSGGFYMTADDGEALLIRDKSLYDGAIPSGNSVATINLLRLFHITGNQKYQQIAEQTINAFGSTIEQAPSAYSQMLQALDFSFGPSMELVVAGNENNQSTCEILDVIRKTFLPNKVVVFRSESQDDPAICKLAEYTLNQRAIDGKTAVYLCRDFACQLPITDVKILKTELEKLSRKNP